MQIEKTTFSKWNGIAILSQTDMNKKATVSAVPNHGLVFSENMDRQKLNDTGIQSSENLFDNHTCNNKIAVKE